MLIKAFLGVALVLTPWVTDLDLQGVPLVGLTAPTLLGIFFIMWMRGDIVSGKVHRERVQDYKDQASEWRDAHGTSEEARATAMTQVERLNDGLRDMALSIKAVAREG